MFPRVLKFHNWVKDNKGEGQGVLGIEVENSSRNCNNFVFPF